MFQRLCYKTLQLKLIHPPNIESHEKFEYVCVYFRCATQLSANDLVVGRVRSAASDPATLGTVRRLAIDKSQ